MEPRGRRRTSCLRRRIRFHLNRVSRFLASLMSSLGCLRVCGSDCSMTFAASDIETVDTPVVGRQRRNSERRLTFGSLAFELTGPVWPTQWTVSPRTCSAAAHHRSPALGATSGR